MNDETFFHEQHLEELEVERSNAHHGEPSPYELAMLVAAMGTGEAAALVNDVVESKDSLQSRFTLARRLYKAARLHLRDQPLLEQKKSEQVSIDKVLKNLPSVNDRGEAVFTFKQLLKETEPAQQDNRKKGVSLLGSITTRTGLLAAIARNFSNAEARRIIQAESLTGTQFNTLIKDPKRRRPRGASV